MNVAIIEFNTNTIKNIIVADSVEIAESLTGLKAVEIPQDVVAHIGLTYTEENGFEQPAVQEEEQGA